MKFIFLLSFIIANYCNAQMSYPSLKYEFNYNSTNKEYKGNVKKVRKVYSLTKSNSLATTNTKDSLSEIDLIRFDLSIDSFDRNGNQIFELYQPKDSTKKSIKYFSYDSIGNLVNIISKYWNSDTITNEWKFEYNYLNKLVNTKINHKGELTVEYNYNYDGRGNLESKELFSKNYYSFEKLKRKDKKVIINSFDRNGFKIEKVEYIDDDSSIFRHSIWYSKSNEILMEREMKQNKINTGIFYLHTQINSKGNFDKNIAAIETQNDKKNNLIKITVQDKVQGKNSTGVVIYKYDLVGNIIEKLITFHNGIQDLIKYEFEYY